MEHVYHGNGIIEIVEDGIIVNKIDDWADLFFDQKCLAIILKRENLNKDFFELKTGFAGELLQKFSNYRKRLVIIGDFTDIKSKAFNNFIYESNKTKQIIFVENIDCAMKTFENKTVLEDS
ncbi:MAG: DUF4180 domain-containing protein [Spirochaetaceae bacterium]|jgi:hypothetical protein|nr:DUF4180 domain-containing protein [Spirochaetaceae bacterium]